MLDYDAMLVYSDLVWSLEIQQVYTDFWIWQRCVFLSNQNETIEELQTVSSMKLTYILNL